MLLYSVTSPDISILLVCLEWRCLQRPGSRKRLPSNNCAIAQHGTARRSISILLVSWRSVGADGMMRSNEASPWQVVVDS